MLRPTRTRCRKTGRSYPRVGNSARPSRSRSITAMARASGCSTVAGRPNARIRRSRSPETRGRLLNLEIHRRCFSPAVLFDLILDLLPFIERAQSSAPDRGDVDEHVFAASLRLDKSIALGWIEPLHGAARHFDLPGHDRGDVILIGDLVAKATTELYTAVFRCGG